MSIEQIMSEDIVQRACNVPSKDLASLLPSSFCPKGHSCTPSNVLTLSVYTANELNRQLKSELFALHEANMRTLSEASSMGWNPHEKKKELFYKDSRFLTVQNSNNKLMGFSMWRFDREGCADEDEAAEIEVLYCYELQLERDARRLGLGSMLVRQLEILAREYGMKKIMLTCYKANPTAMAFYKAQGFVVDAISPNSESSEEEEDTSSEGDWDTSDEKACKAYDYEILSKRILLRS